MAKATVGAVNAKMDSGENDLEGNISLLSTRLQATRTHIPHMWYVCWDMNYRDLLHCRVGCESTLLNAASWAVILDVYLYYFTPQLNGVALLFSHVDANWEAKQVLPSVCDQLVSDQFFHYRKQGKFCRLWLQTFPISLFISSSICF